MDPRSLRPEDHYTLVQTYEFGVTQITVILLRTLGTQPEFALVPLGLSNSTEDPLLGPAREVLGDQRQDEDRLEHEVAVAGDVQAVRRHGVEPQRRGDLRAVDRQGRAGQGGRTQGQDVQPRRQSARRPRSRASFST